MTSELPLLNRDDDSLRQDLTWVTTLATICQCSSSQERDRFMWCREQFTSRGGLPIVFEHFISFSKARPPRFGYLTRGNHGPTATASLALALRSTLQILIGSGGQEAEAGELADLVALAFPKPESLRHLAANANTLLFGFQPEPNRVRVKAYFHTRAILESGHRDRILKILERAGIPHLKDAGAGYDALMSVYPRPSFEGVGVDLGQGRGKLYIRIPTLAASKALSILYQNLRRDQKLAPLEIEKAHFLLDTLNDLLANQVELGLSFLGQKPPGLKLTVFLRPRANARDTLTQVATAFRASGFDPSFLKEAIPNLSGAQSNPSEGNHFLHAVGIELGEDRPSKLNLYLLSRTL